MASNKPQSEAKQPVKDRRKLYAGAAVAAVLLLGLGAFVLHLQPGVRIQSRDMRTCQTNLGLLSTGLLRWIESPQASRSYPGTLDELSKAGFLPPGEQVRTCPTCGSYEYRGGLSPDMPYGTLVAWEDGSPHCFEMPKRGAYVTVNFVTVSLNVEYLLEQVAPGKDAAERICERVRRKIAEQEAGLALVDRARRGDEKVWREVRLLLRGRQRPLLRAFAAYAAGEAKRADLGRDLAAMVPKRAMPWGNLNPEPRYSAALALAKLGRTEGAGFLVEGLEAREYLVRRTCFQALRGLAGESFGYAPYLTEIERARAVARWRTWCRGGR